MIPYTAPDGQQEVFISFNQALANGWISPGGIVLSGHPIFAETLNTPSWDILNDLKFGESSNQRVVLFGEDGLMRQATNAQLDTYIESGEYDRRLTQI